MKLKEYTSVKLIALFLNKFFSKIELNQPFLIKILARFKNNYKFVSEHPKFT